MNGGKKFCDIFFLAKKKERKKNQITASQKETFTTEHMGDSVALCSTFLAANTFSNHISLDRPFRFLIAD